MSAIGAGDEQPVPMRVKSGRMIVVPYELGVNDIRVFIRESHTPEQYYRMVCDHFDTLYRDSATGGRVLCLPASSRCDRHALSDQVSGKGFGLYLFPRWRLANDGLGNRRVVL